MRPTSERTFSGMVRPSDAELVVVEAVFLVPKAGAALGVHGVGDGDEVLEELGGHVLGGRVVAGQFERDGQHRRAIEGHPGRAVRLLEVAAGRQRLGAVEDADVVEAEEAAGEEVAAFEVLPVDPPGEVDDQLLEAAGQEHAVALAAGGGHLVHAPAGPGVDGRVDVAEVELVGGQLAVRVHVPLAQEEHELAAWRKSGSIRAKGIMWKARSQAAYHGYSHLSGMEMTSRL